LREKTLGGKIGRRTRTNWMHEETFYGINVGRHERKVKSYTKNIMLAWIIWTHLSS